MIHRVDAIIQLASWRGTSEREYPGVNVKTDHYYGFLWDLMAASRAATNQVWLVACNAVGRQGKGGYQFWGGSGLWAPSGVGLVQASHDRSELLVVYDINIKGAREEERADFWYYDDFVEVYRPVNDKKAFTRMK